MKSLLYKIFKPIIQIEEESVEFRVGFWKGLWVILLWQIISSIVSIVATLAIGEDFLYNNYIIMILFDIVTLPIITIIVLNTFGKLTWRKNTYKKVNKKLLLNLALLILVFRLLFDAFIFPLLMLIPQGELLKNAESLLSNNLLYFIISACIFAPILEEIICRGIVLNGLLKKFSPIMSIFISSFLFAAAHMNIHQGVNAFALGCIFGYVYYKTKSIYLTMFCHFINNFIALFAFMPTSVPGIIINIIVSVIISIPLIIFIRKNLILNYKENFVSLVSNRNKTIYKEL